MKKKILVIGQAPPAQLQEVPYDTTMLYDWLKELGISKEKAQEMFEWEAVYNKFPGHGSNGHLTPTEDMMDEHWSTLEAKIQTADRVWVLGNIAKEYIMKKEKTWSSNVEWLYTMHPSKRNKGWFEANKPVTIHLIDIFIND